MKVASAAVATTKFVFGMGDGTVESDVDTGRFFARIGDGHAHVRSHVSPGIDWMYQ